MIKSFHKRKVHSAFIDNIWGADLADMQLIRKFNKGLRFLFCGFVLLIFIVNMYGLFLRKIKKALQLLMLFKNQNANQIKYG